MSDLVERSPFTKLDWVRNLMERPEVREQLVDYHRAVFAQAQMARAHYEETGQTVELKDVPHLNTAWQAAFWAVFYALELNPDVRALPKRFTWLGVDYLLIFPAEGPVQIAATSNQQNLCVGLPGWVDPMKVKPKARD